MNADSPVAPARTRALIYFGHAPTQGTGSGIIVYRHLKRFSDAGWRIYIVSDWGQEKLWSFSESHQWPIRILSHRKLWWPPFKPDHAGSRKLRAWLWASEIDAWVGRSTRVDGVLTYLAASSDMLSIAAAGYAKRYQIPLATIVHDDARCFLSDPIQARAAHERRQWILDRSAKVWFASPELGSCFNLPASAVGVLPPIPEGATTAADPRAAVTQHDTGTEPLLIYAGHYWPPQIGLLSQLSEASRRAGGRFLSVVNCRSEDQAVFARQQIEWKAPFERNVDALAYFRSSASAMVVSYCERSADMPWVSSSFPSKLIEYSHLHLPLVIVATADAAVTRWAHRVGFPDVYAPDDITGFQAYVGRLRDPAFVQSRVEWSRRLSQTEFCPDRIQALLASTFA